MFIVNLAGYLIATLMGFCGIVNVFAFLSESSKGVASVERFTQGFAVAAWPLAVAVIVFILTQIALMMEKQQILGSADKNKGDGRASRTLVRPPVDLGLEELSHPAVGLESEKSPVRPPHRVKTRALHESFEDYLKASHQRKEDLIQPPPAEPVPDAEPSAASEPEAGPESGAEPPPASQQEESASGLSFFRVD